MVKNIAKAREINKAHTTFIDTILKQKKLLQKKQKKYQKKLLKNQLSQKK